MKTRPIIENSESGTTLNKPPDEDDGTWLGYDCLEHEGLGPSYSTIRLNIMEQGDRMVIRPT